MAQALGEVQNAGGLVYQDIPLAAPDEKTAATATTKRRNDKEANMLTCRVCQCVESDRNGDTALGFLDISPPSLQFEKFNEDENSMDKASPLVGPDDFPPAKSRIQSRLVEFVSPEGEVFICTADVETGIYQHQDKLINLGCSCKNDLAVAHYACALKWFVNHGSTVCEICGSLAKNVQIADFKKVMASLKDYEALREQTATGEVHRSNLETSSAVDPDAMAAVRRQRLSEIALWFNPQIYNSAGAVVSHGVTEPSSNITTEDASPADNTTTKWAVESTGILVATGLLTVTLAWLIAPRVGKRTARSGLHILLGGICALTVVIFLRFIVLSRIKYGPARYWAILFVFWFLVFGIWASRTHSARAT